MRSMSNSQSVVDSLYLFNQSPSHRLYTLVEFNHYLIYPLLHGKIRIFYENQQPISLVTWCWFSDEQAQLFLEGEYDPTEDDYKKDWDDQLWGIEFIAPYGHSRQTMRRMKELSHTLYRDNNYVHWRRLYNSDKLVKRKF